MRKFQIVAVLSLVTAAWPFPGAADENAITLKEGTGREAVMNNCAACHSLDYIQMNSPFPGGAGWEASVNKMIKVFGAQISPEDAKEIISYLKSQYGS